MLGKLFNLFSSKLVDGFAKELAHDFSKSYKSQGEFSKKGKVPEQKVDQLLAHIFVKTRTFRQENRLGVFKRARLAKKFQDELIFLGYEPELVSRVTTALLTAALSAD